MCVCRNSEKTRIENCFFYDFDVCYVYIYLQNSKTKSQIATVQWLTLYCTRNHIRCYKYGYSVRHTTPHNPIDINKPNGRHVDFICGEPAFFSESYTRLANIYCTTLVHAYKMSFNATQIKMKLVLYIGYILEYKIQIEDAPTGG